MINWPEPGLTMVAVAIAVISLLLILFRQPKSDADVWFAIFSGSIALSLMRPWVADASAWLWWLVVIGGCMTCNGYWLVSRALFRGAGGVSKTQIMIAVGIALLIITYRLTAAEQSAMAQTAATVIDAVLTLASSTILVLAFSEPLLSWSSKMSKAEKQFRIIFILIYASCVLFASVINALAEVSVQALALKSTIINFCAISMIVFTHLALMFRRHHVWPAASATTLAAPTTLPSEEERQLAAALLHQLNVVQSYREPELKVVHLSQQLGTAEHKLSRVITQVLGEKNFNQLINRYRISHACKLLENDTSTLTILEVSLESGFASLGPFNRAFKTAKGCTPTAYRAMRRASDNYDPHNQLV